MPSSTQRIEGLDSLRFFLAFLVAWSHREFATPVSGPAAVLMFFVISGLCIHWPYRHSLQVDAPAFWVRRLTRIGIPGVVAVFMASQFEVKFESIAWSLVAEAIYYALFPALLVARRRWGWGKLIAVSLLPIAVLVAHQEGRWATNFQSGGWRFTWLIGLPVWMSGCLLAEHFDTLPARFSPARLWAYRLIWLGSGIGARALVITDRASYRISLPVVSVMGWVWLREELRAGKKRPAITHLETLGVAAYSVYLAHLFGYRVESAFFGSTGVVGDILFAGAATAVCYFVVERPSHRLAIWLGNRLQRSGRRPKREDRKAA